MENDVSEAALYIEASQRNSVVSIIKVFTNDIEITAKFIKN
jgi:hypothetical protein